ncbi:hypothetical protein CTI12_AA327400 [Artemisia annua]|uniref:Uncharacterized protein n=1 Tax=Artemisia annua TaxID=35608 RepID=A0A2U1MYT2_ARTAN|nr:hypothetical protein CTI12_AA327400 [Artemisia annua]
MKPPKSSNLIPFFTAIALLPDPTISKKEKGNHCSLFFDCSLIHVPVGVSSSCSLKVRVLKLIDKIARTRKICEKRKTVTPVCFLTANEAERRRKGKAVAHEISSDIEMDFPSGSETDSENDAGEYERQLSVAILESWNSFYNSGLNLNSHALPTVTGPTRGAETEYERQLNVAIQESLKSFNNSGLNLN